MLYSAVLGLEKGRSAGAELLDKVPAWSRISLPTTVTQTLGSSSPTDIWLRKVQIVLEKNKMTVQAKREYPLS